ncbi:MAG: hypothetical protein IT304_01780 [Dehalococcoidia bacterium]|nr:hypothetical protein [Dehalococcoidia bacterium]
MTEPLQVGQFAIVDSEPVDRGPNAGLFRGKGPADDRAELFIVAEGTTPAAEAFAGHIVSGAGHTWAGLDMSLTGSLRRLFDDAQGSLRDWNRKSIAQHHVSIGLTCFARRGGQDVIAQAGPSAAFHYSAGTVTPYFTDEEHGRPLGAGGGSEPQLTRVAFAPGDRMLLISTAALRNLDDELIEGILALPEEQILPNLYRRLEHLRQLTVLLVTCPGGGASTTRPGVMEADAPVIDATSGGVMPALPEPDMERPGPSAPPSYQPSLFIQRSENAVELARRQLLEVTARARHARAIPGEAVEAMPAPLRRASGDNPLARLAAERQARVALAALAPAASHGSRASWRPVTGAPGYGDVLADSRRSHRRRDSFSRGLVREEPPPRPAVILDDVPLVDELAEGARARPIVVSAVSETIAGENAATISGGGSLVRVRGGMSGRWKGGGALSTRGATTIGSLPPTWLIIVIGLGVLLTIVGFLTVPGLLNKDEAARYASLLDSAYQRLSTARAVQDPADRRKALTEAQALLLEARDAPNHTPEADQLLKDVATELGAMDAVRSPQAVEVIASLEQFGDKPVAAVRLTIGREAAYILDAASSQVIALTIGTAERKIVFGEDKDAKRSRPIATAYLDGNDLGEPSLLVVDAGRALWAYSPGSGLRQVPFAAPQSLQVTDIAVYGRDLYVLDAAQSAVYRFAMGDGGYASPPAKVLETTDLAAARRLMVDGEIVTSDANGTLHRFAAQLALVLSEAGIDRKLAAPDLAQPLTPNGDLAVLDAPNDRIVVFHRDGTFAYQFRHKDFQATSAFALRDGSGYVFSGGKLRRITW